jgi:hypothetical protein
VTKLLLVELNEINFDFVAKYIRHGRLPVFRRLIEAHGIHQTSSEQRFEELEPWIQWVTAHTGLSLAEHGVFRLGDIVDHDIPQIWEQLEGEGLRVGAISPMNARNLTRNAAYFVPDPWTRTNVTGSWFLRRMHGAICLAVNANAESRVPLTTLLVLVIGLLRYARPANYVKYLRLAAGGVQRRWLRALLLDLFLGDVFIRLTRTTQPDFASLFVNAGAHIQHHYMFNSTAYGGGARNPTWYVRAGDDPVLDAYELYDRMVGQVIDALPDYRLMIATGLRQVPHERTTFYWRLRDHESFLRRIGIAGATVEPRMSRDFIVRFETADEAARAEVILRAARATDGIELFEVDNRGDSLFVMLTYPRDIGMDFEFMIGNRRLVGLKDDVVFVAIKNGEHDGIGTFLDTGLRAGTKPGEFELRELPLRVRTAVCS